MWTKFSVWRLRRREKKLESMCSYHYDKRIEYTHRAYNIDQFHQPRRWGELQSHANWHGFWLIRCREELNKVRADLKSFGCT